jgi:hypothetical protein
MPGNRSFALVRARARGQRRRGALHPNFEGEPAVGEDLLFEDDGYSGASLIRPRLERVRDPARPGP